MLLASASAPVSAQDNVAIIDGGPKMASAPVELSTPVRAVDSSFPQQPKKRPRFQLTSGGNSGPVILALIDIERGFPNGDSHCPPETDWDAGDICLGADIVIHRGAVVRRYGASDNIDRKWRSAKFKQIGGHAVRWVEGGYWLAVIEQTGKDYYYIQWKTDATRGRFCLPETMIDHYRLETKVRFKRNDDGDRCYAARLSDHR